MVLLSCHFTSFLRLSLKIYYKLSYTYTYYRLFILNFSCTSTNVRLSLHKLQRLHHLSIKRYTNSINIFVQYHFAADKYQGDSYALCRMFTTFDFSSPSKIKRSPLLCNSQATPQNIFYYGGDDHTDLILQCLLDIFGESSLKCTTYKITKKHPKRIYHTDKQISISKISFLEKKTKKRISTIFQATL